MAALVYVFKAYFKTPIGLPAHTAIVWVIPFIIGIGLTKKFGAGIYIGLIAGLLLGTVGMADKGPLEVLEYLAMGATMDIIALIFKGHIGNVLVGCLLGAFGSFDKTIVNYTIMSQIGGTAHILIAGIFVGGVSSLVFGGAGGIISSIIVNRVQHIHFPRHTPKKANVSTATK
jgi:hypothetical protein